MLNFIEYITETKVYRGIIDKNRERTNKSSIRWYTPKFDIALEYAEGDKSKVDEFNFNLSKVLDFGSDTRHLTIGDLISEVLSQSKPASKDFTEIQELMEKLRKRFGNKSKRIIDFWDMQDNYIFCKFVLLCGWKIFKVDQGKIPLYAIIQI